MRPNKSESLFLRIFKYLSLSVCSLCLFVFLYLTGYSTGTQVATVNAIISLQENTVPTKNITPSETKPANSPIATLAPKPTTQPRPSTVFSGPSVWAEVNKKRQSYGVSTLAQRDELCTIASIRLNELLDLGNLDGHSGFANLSDRRPDLKWIFEKYNISEFLLMGARSSVDAVEMWENTLGHKKLLTGGEYVWGCVYAQNGFAVAISAY
jgi:uncharacterized protein YkwD